MLATANRSRVSQHSCYKNFGAKLHPHRSGAYRRRVGVIDPVETCISPSLITTVCTIRLLRVRTAWTYGGDGAPMPLVAGRRLFPHDEFRRFRSNGVRHK